MLLSSSLEHLLLLESLLLVLSLGCLELGGGSGGLEGLREGGGGVVGVGHFGSRWRVASALSGWCWVCYCFDVGEGGRKSAKLIRV